MNHRRKLRGGQAVVELALIFPFFLLLIIGGIIDFGFAFYNHLTLQQMANSAAMWAAENASVSASTDGAVVEYCVSLRPSWWNGSFTVQAPEKIKLPDDSNAVRIVISFESPAYTPFYKTIFSATTGQSGLRLVADATYKIPEMIKNRCISD